MSERELQDKEILKEQVKQLYGLAPLGFVATFMNATIVFFVMKEVLPRPFLLLWLAAIMVVTLARILLVLSFRGEQFTRVGPECWRRRFTAGLFVVGVAWGSISFTPFTFSLSHEVFMAFVLGGMAAGASSTYTQVRFGYLAYSIPALLPLAVRFLVHPGAFHRAMSCMTFLYFILLWRISEHNYRVNRTSLLLRFENAGMIETLSRAKRDMEALNAMLVAEIQAKQHAEAELRKQQDQLEKTVAERTSDLMEANQQLKEAQAKLMAAKEAAELGSRAKSEFLANMSHEMRTPLAGVLGMIRLVLDMKIGDEERSLLEMARRSADSLLRLIGDVLDFSRVEAGVMKFDRKRFPVEETVKSAVEVVSLSALEKGLELSWKVEAGVRDVVGDQGRLRQVLVNLLGNAVKFTEKGRVEVAVRPLVETGGGRFVLFSVSDTGVGIPAEQLSSVFEKFTQLDSSLTRRYGGTGLGLALSKQIVEKCGGRIWVESREGAGSVFSFTIPAPAADQH